MIISPESKIPSNKRQRRCGKAKHVTLARFPVVGEVKAVWAEAKSASRRVQANMGTSPVVGRALVDILAGVIIRGQFVARNIGTVALVAPFEIDASALARPVPVIHQALVNVWTGNNQAILWIAFENLTERTGYDSLPRSPFLLSRRYRGPIVSSRNIRRRRLMITRFTLVWTWNFEGTKYSSFG